MPQTNERWPEDFEDETNPVELNEDPYDSLDDFDFDPGEGNSDPEAVLSSGEWNPEEWNPGEFDF